MNLYEFVLDKRLGIQLPILHREWTEYSIKEQSDVLDRWESIRGRIPDRVKALEKEINHKQERLSMEEDFALSCRLNSEIADLASCINDLHLWYRTQQEMTMVVGEK